MTAAWSARVPQMTPLPQALLGRFKPNHTTAGHTCAVVHAMREGNSLELGVGQSGLEWLVNHSFYRHGCEAVEGDVR